MNKANISNSMVVSCLNQFDNLLCYGLFQVSVAFMQEPVIRFTEQLFDWFQYEKQHWITTG